MKDYQTLQGKYADLLGSLVEARIEALLNHFDNHTVSGDFFHTIVEVTLPKFIYVGDTVVKPFGSRQYQIDLQGEWYLDNYDAWTWVVEVKWWQSKITPSVVEKFVAAYEALKQEIELIGIVPRLVNRGGFSSGVVEALETHGIYYSGPAEINQLLNLFGIERLLRDAK